MEKKYLGNEGGFVLLTALMMLVVLMVIGLIATDTTTVELQVAGNGKADKQTFYQADGGGEAGMSLLQENIAEGGFDAAGDYYGVDVSEPAFYMNDSLSGVDASMTIDGELTELRYFGLPPELNPGSAGQMAAGYEGIGKGMPGGGATKVYSIQSRHTGALNSSVAIRIQWRELL